MNGDDERPSSGASLFRLDEVSRGRCSSPALSYTSPGDLEEAVAPANGAVIADLAGLAVEP